MAPDELAGLGHLWERRDADRGEACFREALVRGLAGAGRARLLGRLAWGEKRRARWAEARALWDELAREQRSFDPRPWEEMAKIDEHRLRDWTRARSVVQEALARAEAGRAATEAREALGYRLERLERRLGRKSWAWIDRPSAAGKVTTCSTCACARTRVPVGRVDEDGCEECTRCPEGRSMQ